MALKTPCLTARGASREGFVFGRRGSHCSATSSRASSRESIFSASTTASSVAQERIGEYSLDQLWSYLDLFSKLDLNCSGTLGRSEYIAATQTLGTDLDFLKMANKLGLAARFKSSATEFSLGDYIAALLPRAGANELARASRLATLWQVHHALSQCGTSGDANEMRLLFNALEENPGNGVDIKDLLRAQLFSEDEILDHLPPRGSFDGLVFDDFNAHLSGLLKQKFKRIDHLPLPAGLLQQKMQVGTSEMFQAMLACMHRVSIVPKDAGDMEAHPPATARRRLSLKQGLPPLPTTSAPSTARNFRRKSLGSMTDRELLETSKERSEENSEASAPRQRFETKRAQEVRAVCTGDTSSGDECLRKYEFLKDCTPLFLSFLMDELSCEMYKPGDVIIKEGEVGDKLFLLRRGSVEILVGPNMTKVAQLQEGVAFGEMALFDPSGKRAATVRAAGLCDCRTVNHRTFMKLLGCFPEDKEFFKKVAQQRRATLSKPVETCASRRRNSSIRTSRDLSSVEKPRPRVVQPLVAAS